ncbi:hypothetical_protein [Leishmania major strain Friedlin]|nr:hypothetical_protein [Leishmania major strain Friedlin]
MGPIDSSCVVATLTSSKVGASSSCPGTATSAGEIDEPASRAAASTPMPPASEAHEGGAVTASSASAPLVNIDSAALREGGLPSAEGLTCIARSRYDASPARLLLKLWRFLAADVFASVYQVVDAFGDDAVWCDCGEAGDSAALPTQLPLMASHELATFAGTASTDLPAASFRIPELLALFRHSSTSLENTLRY